MASWNAIHKDEQSGIEYAQLSRVSREIALSFIESYYDGLKKMSLYLWHYEEEGRLLTSVRMEKI